MHVYRVISSFIRLSLIRILRARHCWAPSPEYTRPLHVCLYLSGPGYLKVAKRITLLAGSLCIASI